MTVTDPCFPLQRGPNGDQPVGLDRPLVLTSQLDGKEDTNSVGAQMPAAPWAWSRPRPPARGVGVLEGVGEASGADAVAGAELRGPRRPSGRAPERRSPARPRRRRRAVTSGDITVMLLKRVAWEARGVRLLALNPTHNEARGDRQRLREPGPSRVSRGSRSSPCSTTTVSARRDRRHRLPHPRRSCVRARPHHRRPRLGRWDWGLTEFLGDERL